MLNTNTYTLVMCEQPEVMIRYLEQVTMRNHCILVSAIYTGVRFGGSVRKASPSHALRVEVFCVCLDAVLAWDRAAVDASTDIKVALRLVGTPIGPNDTAIAGHAIAVGAVLVTNNVREFERVPGLVLEDWAG